MLLATWASDGTDSAPSEGVDSLEALGVGGAAEYHCNSLVAMVSWRSILSCSALLVGSLPSILMATIFMTSFSSWKCHFGNFTQMKILMWLSY